MTQQISPQSAVSAARPSASLRARLVGPAEESPDIIADGAQ